MPSEDLWIDLELGHWAAYRDEPTEEQYTHDWKFYIKGKDDHDTTKYINKVVFKLHETFPNPIREFRQPPYEVCESGYGGFEVTIEIYLKKIFDLPKKKIVLTYDLYLPSQDASPVTNKLFEKLTFERPSEELRSRLLKCGAYPVAVHPDSTTHSRQVSEKPKAVVVPQPKHSISSESEAEDSLVSRSVPSHLLSSNVNRKLSGSSKTKASKTTSVKPEGPPSSSNSLGKEKSAEKRKPETVTNSNSVADPESFGGGGIFSHAGKPRTSSSDKSSRSESSRNEDQTSVKKQKIDNVSKPSSKSISHRESKSSTSTSGSEHGKSDKSSHHRSSERSESSSRDKFSSQRSHSSSKKTSSSSEEQSHNQVKSAKSRSSSSTSPSKHRHHDKSVKGSMDKEKLEDNKTSLSLTASLSLSDDSMGSVPSCSNVDDLNMGSVSPFMTSGEVDDGFSQPLDRLLENMTSDLDGISDSVGLTEIKKEPGVVKNTSKALSEKENKISAARKMKTGKESEADVNRKSKEVSGHAQKIETSKLLDKHSADYTDLSISSYKVRAVSSDSAAKESNVKQEKQKTKNKSKDESEASAKVEHSSSALQKTSKLKESDVKQNKAVSEVRHVASKIDKEEKKLNDKSASSKNSKVSENPQKRSKSPAVVASSTDAAKSSQSLKQKKVKENTNVKQEVRASTDKSSEKASADKSSSASKMSADSTKHDKSVVDTSRDLKNADSTQRFDGNRDVSASGIDPNTYRAPNGETLSALMKIQRILMDSNDRDLLQEVVDIIENTGIYQLSSDTFDFDLCSLDAETLDQIKKCMKLPDS